MKKKALVLLLAMAMVFTFMLSACGGGGDEGSEQFVVAMSPDFAPMEFIDTSKEGDDQYVGFDVTLAVRGAA